MVFEIATSMLLLSLLDMKQPLDDEKSAGLARRIELGGLVG